MHGAFFCQPPLGQSFGLIELTSSKNEAHLVHRNAFSLLNESTQTVARRKFAHKHFDRITSPVFLTRWVAESRFVGNFGRFHATSVLRDAVDEVVGTRRIASLVDAFAQLVVFMCVVQALSPHFVDQRRGIDLSALPVLHATLEFQKSDVLLN